MTGGRADSADPPAAHPDHNPGSRAFDSLSIPAFRKIWLSGLLAFLAVGFQITARGLLALELRDSATALGVVAIVFGVALVIATPFGGVLADRMSRRNVVLGAHAGLTVSAWGIGITEAADVTTFWMLLLSAAVQGVSFAFMGPARIGITTQIIDGPRLANALSLTQLTVSGSQIVGPLLAGILVTVPGIGLSGVYFVGGALTAAGAIPIAMLPRAKPPTIDKPSPFAELASGLRYIRSAPRLNGLLISTAALSFVAVSYLTFLPKVADDLFVVGSGWLGAFFAANAVGGTLMSLWCARLSAEAEILRMRLIGGFGIALGLFVFAGVPDEWTALPVLAVLGAAAMSFQTMSMTAALTIADPEYHGRVQSVLMISASAPALASLPIGVLVDQIGLRPAHALMGAGAFAIAAYIALKQQDRPGGANHG